MKSDKKLDASGLSCLMPIVEVAATMKNMKPGEILEVTASDPAFCPDIEVWIEKMDYTLLEMKKKNESCIVYIKKS